MNARQRKFVAAYQGNATEAAKAAGYGAKSAHVAGSRLLRNVEVAAAIAARSPAARDEKRLIWTREDRQAFWTRVATGVEPDCDTKDRLKATELLGKSERDFVERVELEGKVSLEALVLASIKDNE